jgi:hypothetical protein
MTSLALESESASNTIRATESWDSDDDLLFDDNESIGDLRDSQTSNPQTNARRRASNIRPFANLKTLEENDKEDITQAFEISTDDIEGAFNMVRKAGIPIPKDTPSSALIGGTINRLGSSLRKNKPMNMDDWAEDLDISEGATLKFSARPGRRTPSPLPPEFALKSSTPPDATAKEHAKDDFEGDFDIPADMGTFELKSPSMRKEVTTPLPPDEMDDWVEGSLGTRYAGTRRVGVLSDFSPSASSAITVESDADDPMEGLEFNSSHVNLQDVLERRMKERAQETSPTKPRLPRKRSGEEDLLGGLIIDDEENPFQASKLKANRNILQRLQESTPASPQRKVAVSVTFAKPSRIPRPSTTPVPGPSPTPPLPSPTIPHRQYTHRPASARLSDQFNEKSLQKKPSVANFSQFHSTQADSIRNRALGAKTSMPALRAAALASPTRRIPPPPVPPLPTATERSKSRTGGRISADSGSRIESPRPRSPEISRNDLHSSRPAFIPGGASVTTSHHVAALKAPQRQGSVSTMRSTSTSGKRTPIFAPESLRKEALRTKVLTTPRRIRDFGDGTELDAFDDLPVSAAVEKKYRVQAKGVGTPNGVHRFTTPNSTVRKPTDGITFALSGLTLENRKEVVSKIDWRNPVPARMQPRTLQKPPRKLMPSSKQNTIKGKPKPPGKGPTLIKNLNSSHESKGNPPNFR